MEIANVGNDPVRRSSEFKPTRTPALKRFSPNRIESFDSTEFDPEAQNLLLNARVLFRNQEVELAKSLLAESLRINPENPRALALLRDCFEATQEFASALKINLALEAEREDAILMKKTGDLALRVGQDQLAQQSYLRALGHFENEKDEIFDVLKNLGNLSLRSGDIEGAQEYYHRAFRLQPHSDSLLVNLGTLEMQRGGFELAIHRFQQALSVEPKSSKAYVGLAMCYHELGDIDLAWGNLDQALDIDGSHTTALQLCAAWGMTDARGHLPIQRLQSYLETNPTDDQFTYLLAALLMQVRRFEDAWFEVQKLFWINPSHVGIPQLIADLESHRSAA